MSVNMPVRNPASYGYLLVVPLYRQPVSSFIVNVIVQDGAFPNTAAAFQEIAMDMRYAQSIFDTNANANAACPRIKLQFNPYRNIRFTGEHTASINANSMLEVFLLLSRMGGWKQWDGGLPCINLYYLNDLPDTPGGTTTGGHIPGALTHCNQRTIRIMNNMLAELSEAIQTANGSLGPVELQNYIDTATQIRQCPSIYLDVKRRRGTTLAHEIAHLFGLQHHSDPNNLMFPAANLRTGISLTNEQAGCLVTGIEQYSQGQFPFKQKAVV